MVKLEQNHLSANNHGEIRASYSQHYGNYGNYGKNCDCS